MNIHYNKDCFFYTEWQDMHAHIPYCRYAKEINSPPDYMSMGHCVNNCPYYYSNKNVSDLVRKEVKRIGLIKNSWENKND